MVRVGVNDFDDFERACPTVAKLFEFRGVGVCAECICMNEDEISGSEGCWRTIARMLHHMVHCFLERIASFIVVCLMGMEERFHCVVASFDRTIGEVKGEVGMMVIYEVKG